MALFCVGTVTAPAQNDSSVALDGEDLYQALFDDTEDETDEQPAMDELDELRQHPIDLRTVRYADLLAVPILSPFTAERIVAHADSIGFLSVDELRSIPGISEEIYVRIAPFFCVTEKEKGWQWNSIGGTLRMRSTMRLKMPKGVRENKFLGAYRGDYSRLRLTNGIVEGGLVFEKDAGERYDDGFGNGYLSVSLPEHEERLIVGSYTVSAGEGLLTSRSGTASKGGDVLGQVHRKGRILSPSLSANEVRYFRGAAASVSLGGVSAVPFYSLRKVDGTKDSTGTVIAEFSSGLFRDSTSLIRKDITQERIAGIVSELSVMPGFHVGAGAIQLSYDDPFDAEKFHFTDGRRLTAMSLFADLTAGQFTLFGESAANTFSRVSTVAGIRYDHDDQFAAVFHHRNYSRGFVNPLAHPFGDRSALGDGEQGNYLAVSFRPDASISLAAYADEYTFPDDSGNDTRGDDVLIRCEVRTTEDLTVSAVHRRQWRWQSGLSGMDDERRRSTYRLMYRYRIMPSLFLTNRADMCSVEYRPSGMTEHGFQTLFDLRYFPSTASIGFAVRYVLFGTDGYDARLYEFESDVPGHFSNPPLYGNGSRWYLLLRWRPIRHAMLSIRYAETKRIGADVLGSGDDEIDGDLDDQVNLQLDIEL